MLLRLKIGLSVVFLSCVAQVAAAETVKNSGFEVSFKQIKSISTAISKSQCEDLLQPFVLTSEARSKLRTQPIVVSPFNSILSLHRPASAKKTSSSNKKQQWQGFSRISLDHGKTFVKTPFSATENQEKGTGKLLISEYCQATFVFHKI